MLSAYANKKERSAFFSKNEIISAHIYVNNVIELLSQAMGHALKFPKAC